MATAVTSNATEDSQAKDSTSTGHVASKPGPPSGPMPQYTAFSPGRQRFILGIVTAAGFFGPLAGGIYLPALPTLQEAFNASATAINATVSVFMGVLAVAVSTPCSVGFSAIARVAGENPHYSTVMLNIEISSLAHSVIRMLTVIIATLLGFSSGLWRSQASVYGLLDDIYRGEYSSCGRSSESGRSFYPKNFARFRCCQRSLPGSGNGRRHNSAQRKSFRHVDRTARPSDGSCARSTAWGCYYR